MVKDVYDQNIPTVAFWSLATSPRPRRHPAWQADVAQDSARSNLIFYMGRALLMAHLIWPLMAHHWCAITSTPLVIFTNGAPPGAPLVSGILMAHRGCAISIGQGAPLVCLPGAMYIQVLLHTNGAPPLDAPLVTAAY